MEYQNVRSVMSLHDGAKTRVRVDSELSKDFEVNVELHQGAMMSPFFAIVVVVVSSPHQSLRCGA